jgi:RHS repeat-associated protein
MDAYNGLTITPYYFHTNAIGSTTAVTNANGQVVERYKYGLYGMPTFMDAAGNVIPKSTIGNNILFQGREYEPETNFYYYRARHLDPIMGRFLQTDPMGYEDSLNLYQAFGMNPVNFVDPMGTLTGHGDEYNVMARAGVPHELNQYLNQRSRSFNLKVLKNTAIAAGLFVVAAKLSVPTIIAGTVTLMSYSGMESYSQRKQAGQTEKQATKGALGAAFGFNLLFNALGYDFGTLDEVEQKKVEEAWSWIIGGGLGAWLGKRIPLINQKIIASSDFSMVDNPGPLASMRGNPAGNFLGGRYRAVKLESDLILYRGGKAGGGRNAYGQWFTFKPPASAAKVRIDSAVKPQWINPKTGILEASSPIESVYTIKIPKGTVIYVGPTGSQGGVYVGGANMTQVFVPKPWEIRGVQVLEETLIR